MKLVPLDSSNHGAYTQTKIGPLDPQGFFRYVALNIELFF